MFKVVLTEKNKDCVLNSIYLHYGVFRYNLGNTAFIIFTKDDFKTLTAEDFVEFYECEFPLVKSEPLILKAFDEMAKQKISYTPGYFWLNIDGLFVVEKIEDSESINLVRVYEGSNFEALKSESPGVYLFQENSFELLKLCSVIYSLSAKQYYVVAENDRAFNKIDLFKDS